MLESKKRAERIILCMTALALSGCILLTGCHERTQEDDLKELNLSETHNESGSETGEPEKKEEKEGTGTSGKTEAGPDNTEAETRGRSSEATVYVYVCGAVNAPGVYQLRKDARVFEAVRLAGGVREDADADAVNQARIVADGEQIYVPYVGEAQSAGVAGTEVIQGTENKKININTAGKEELMTLTGIGESKAQSILDYREENGGFQNIEELMEIEGIKEGVFNKIKEDITI